MKQKEEKLDFAKEANHQQKLSVWEEKAKEEQVRESLREKH